jgi:deazaflavin-dependent oxidoreductase (nitroreductase family)
MVATTEARPRPAREQRPAQGLEARFFRTLNRVIEPIAESGCFSPVFWPTGLVVLETTGRRTGKPHRNPVLAMLMDGHLIVRTFRGERSDWFNNLRANPRVAYWAGGERIAARATVHAPGEECSTEGLPPFAAAGVAAAGLAVELMGWRFAVLERLPEGRAR